LIQRYMDPPFDFGTFADVPLRPGIAVAGAPQSGPMLEAAQKRTLLKADLRDYFDLSGPGTYKVNAKFQVPGQLPSQAFEQTFFVRPGKL
jgi:hypothetical protein